MKQKSTEFLKKMLEFLPSTETEYRSTVEFNKGVLETVIIEDVFMPEIIKLLKKNDNVELLKTIFDYFEEVSNDDDAHLLNIFSVTVLEILGNEREILEIARKYMGPKTFELQIQADRDIGRDV